MCASSRGACVASWVQVSRASEARRRCGGAVGAAFPLNHAIVLYCRYRLHRPKICARASWGLAHSLRYCMLCALPPALSHERCRSADESAEAEDDARQERERRTRRILGRMPAATALSSHSSLPCTCDLSLPLAIRPCRSCPFVHLLDVGHCWCWWSLIGTNAPLF